MAIWIVLPILTLLMFDLGLCVTALILVAIGCSSLLSRLVRPAILYSLMMNIVLLIYVGILRKRDKKLKGCLRIC